MDVSSQPIGSMEFKIEVASACAESGMNYKDFAKLYNLNADELNVWAVEFLGDGFKYWWVLRRDFYCACEFSKF